MIQAVSVTVLFLWSLVWDYQFSGGYMRVGKVKLFLLGAAAVGAVHISKVWHWSLGAFFLWAICQSLHYANPNGFLDITLIMATLFFSQVILDHAGKWVGASLIFAGAVNAVIGVLDMFSIFPFMKPEVYMESPLPLGLMGSPTTLGPLLCVSFFFSLAGLIKGKFGHFSLCALLFGVILLTKSSMTYGAFIVGSMAFALFYSPKLTAGVAVTSAAALLVASHYDANIFWHSGRTEPWKDAYDLWIQRPLIGFGPGFWAQAAEEIRKARNERFAWSQVHQEFLQGLVEYGAIGMGLVTVFLGKVGLSSINAIRAGRRELASYVAGLSALLANSLATPTFHITPLAQIACLLSLTILRGPGWRPRHL